MAKPPRGTPVGEDAHDEDEPDKLDPGPWVETPRSSRMSSFRFDYASNALHVTFKSGRTYTYENVSETQFNSMVKAPSKGGHLNTAFGGHSYRHATPQEIHAPSSAERKAKKG